MKLRIKGNSLRLRVSQSDVAALLESSKIADCIHFGVDPDASLTYALELVTGDQQIQVAYQPQRITVTLSSAEAQQWAATNQVGIYGSFKIGDGNLELSVEKDFACLDGADAPDADAFPNPNAGTAC